MLLFIFLISEAPFLLGLVFLAGIIGKVSDWVYLNLRLIATIVYFVDIILVIVQFFINRHRNGKVYFLPSLFTAFFSAVTLLYSSNYVLLILAVLAKEACFGHFGVLGVLILGPIGGLSAVFCKFPSLCVALELNSKAENMSWYKDHIAPDPWGDALSSFLLAIVTVALCTLCRWMFEFPLFPWS